MGQKITPTSIRVTNNYSLISPEKTFVFNLMLFKTIAYYFNKKGFLINNINFYINDNILYINLNFFLSKNSKLYTKKYRKFLMRSKKDIKKNRYFLSFLKSLARICSVKKIYLKAKRLDLKIKKKTLTSIIINANKIGLYRYKKNKHIKDLIIAFCLLLETGKINSSVFNQIMVNYFSWLPKRQHKRFLTFLRDFFQIFFLLDKKNNNYIKGIKLLVSGRIAGKTQASNFQFIIGRIFTQSIDTNIDFNKTVSYSKLGTYGWKLWITKNKLKVC